jgi:acetylglutamate kinase
MRILVKIGGAQLEEAGARLAFAGALRAAARAGHELVVVHGGGNQIRELGRRLQLPERYHQGLRITDAETAQLVLIVLGGLVNRWLVHALQEAGLPAAGLTGADGGTFDVEKHEPGGTDLGYVGAVRRVDKTLVETLLRARFVPVIATVAPLAPDAPGAHDRFYNVNADLAAGPLARALDAQALLFLTDVLGVLDASGRLLPHLTPATCARLRAARTLTGGMLPKVDAAVQALRHHPGCLVKIAPAAGPDAVLQALAEGTGTRFTSGERTDG